MASKLKTWMKPTKKGLTTRIRKRVQPPTDLLSSDEGFTNEDKSELPQKRRSVSRFTLPPSVLDGPQSEGIQPRAPDALDGLQSIEEQLRVRLIERLRCTPAAYLPTTDEDAGQNEPLQVSG